MEKLVRANNKVIYVANKAKKPHSDCIGAVWWISISERWGWLAVQRFTKFVGDGCVRAFACDDGWMRSIKIQQSYNKAKN